MSTSESRLFGMDVLRGTAMVLGIVLHGAITYKAGYHFGELIHDPQAEYYFYDWLHTLINSFRMQLFFLLAGFFARMMVLKKGVPEFIRNRFKRIAVPLAIAYITILPATCVPVIFYQNLANNPWHEVKEFLIGFYTLRRFYGLMHLWFLYDLLIFYAACLLFNQISLLREKADKLFSSLSFLSFTVLLFFMTSLLSQLYRTPVPTIWVGFFTPVAQLLYYGSFFFVGWLLQEHRRLLASFSSVYVGFLSTGIILSIGNSTLLNLFFTKDVVPTAYLMFFRLGYALQTVLMVVGLIGWFNKVFSAPGNGKRYFADSAYWVYLIHNPIVLTLQLVMLESWVSPVLRFPIVVIVTAILSYGSYHLFVRYTAIGRLLNGPRVRS